MFMKHYDVGQRTWLGILGGKTLQMRHALFSKRPMLLRENHFLQAYYHQSTVNDYHYVIVCGVIMCISFHERGDYMIVLYCN